ncbi:MAG TPA: hypothetical protein VHX65_17855 [Pirellulales bacterium]|jgi:hypothetical protein|nr:hypothetical protein [Pirellulales bacterium]
MDRSRLAILLMFVVACGLGLVSVGYHTWASHGVLAWWGGDMARLIADAPRVEALRLRPADESKKTPAGAASADMLLVTGKAYVVVQRKDVTAALGLDHLRRGLLDDGNFVWPAKAEPAAVRWSDALVFSDTTRRLVVVFDFVDHRIGRTDGATTLEIDQIARGWQDFFAAELP